MRWKSLVGGLALLLAAVGGCKQPIYTNPDEYKYYLEKLPQGICENDPHVGSVPLIDLAATPATVLDPERPIRYLSLAEANAIALEQGTIGNQSLLGSLFPVLSIANATNDSPTASDTTVTFAGGRLNTAGSDAIRVLRLDPATIGAGIETAMSRFDALWSSTASWSSQDRPIGTSLDTFQAVGSNLSAIEQAGATISTGIIKPLATGGVAGITFSTVYTDTNLPSRVNPSYQPTLQFSFEQPLLQGFGVEINQLRGSHPGDVLNLFPGLIGVNLASAEGILVTRLRFDQQRAELERVVNIMIANVEVAYWNLYNAYWELYSAEQGLRQAYETWKIAKAKFDAGSANIADLNQARSQYEQFRATRLNTIFLVQEDERQLRAMLQMHVEDGTRLVPCDAPTLAPYNPDWCSSLQEALTKRPELVMAREDIKANQLSVLNIKNTLLPDLRFGLQYDINDIGDRLDGVSADSAFHNLGSDHFNNWTAQLRLNVPIGYRQAESSLRIAKLQLARSVEVLRDQELKTERLLGIQYRKIIVNYELIKVYRSAREAAAEQLKARFQAYLAGRQDATIDKLLDAQRVWANALQQEYISIRDYNNAIVAWELTKGTIQERNNIHIAEGVLPLGAQQRAVEHEQERNKALLLREHAAPVTLDHAPAMVDVLAPDNNVSVVHLWQTSPPLKDVPILPTSDKLITNGAVQQVKATDRNSTAPVVPAVATSAGSEKTSSSSPLAAPMTPASRPSQQSPQSGCKNTDFGALRPIQNNDVPAASTLLVPPPPIPTGSR